VKPRAAAIFASLAVHACSPTPPSLYVVEVDLPELHRCDGRERSLLQPTRPADCSAPPCGWYDLYVVSERGEGDRLNLYATAVEAWGPLPPPLQPPAVDHPYDRTPEGHYFVPGTEISKNVAAIDLERTLRPALIAAPPNGADPDQKCVMLDPSQRLSSGDVVRMHKALTRLGVRRTNLVAREAID